MRLVDFELVCHRLRHGGGGFVWGRGVTEVREMGVYNLLCSSFQNQCMMADTMVVRVM